MDNLFGWEGTKEENIWEGRTPEEIGGVVDDLFISGAQGNLAGDVAHGILERNNINPRWADLARLALTRGRGGAPIILRIKPDNKQVNDAAKAFGIPKNLRDEYGRYIELNKSDAGRPGNKNYSWKELEDLADEFMGR